MDMHEQLERESIEIRADNIRLKASLAGCQGKIYTLERERLEFKNVRLDYEALKKDHRELVEVHGETLRRMDHMNEDLADSTKELSNNIPGRSC